MSKQQPFDLMLIKFGYNTWAMPKAPAMALFEALQGCDIYRVENKWIDSGYIDLARLVTTDEMPSLALIGPVAFHQALENHRMAEEAKEAKK